MGYIFRSYIADDRRLRSHKTVFFASIPEEPPTRPAMVVVADGVCSHICRNGIPGSTGDCVAGSSAALFEIDISPNFSPKPPRKFYQFHKGEYTGLKASLSTLAAEYSATRPESNTADENWSFISTKVLESIDKFIQQKMSKGKRHLPWVSNTVKRLMNKRDRPYKKARRSGKALHLIKYKRLCNTTTKRLRDAHDKNLNEVMGVSTPGTGPENAGSYGAKHTWSYLKLLRTESQGIPALVANNRVCSSDSAKAEALREQYDSVLRRPTHLTVCASLSL